MVAAADHIPQVSGPFSPQSLVTTPGKQVAPFVAFYNQQGVLVAYSVLGPWGGTNICVNNTGFDKNKQSSKHRRDFQLSFPVVSMT